MTTTTTAVPLTAEQIKLLRDALNLAAEYTADIPDDPSGYSEWDQYRINTEIARFRHLDDYLQQFELKEAQQ